MKKLVCLILALVIATLAFASCGTTQDKDTIGDTSSKTVYTVGICNFVDDASLNQIIANIRSELDALGKQAHVAYKIKESNCNTDSQVLNQIIQNFITDDVDLMVGVATPVAMAMQGATTVTPVVFAAVSDPLGAQLVDSLEVPGHNITGTSDYLDTNAIMNLIFAQNPEAKTIGLLYDLGQDSSKTAIAEAKAYLDQKGVSYKEYNGSNAVEIQAAVSSLVADQVDAVFTPSDNTVMAAELSIYETLANAKIPHYAGADSFALNGAFVGYGVDYANLGRKTGEMVHDILFNKKDISQVSVRTFDNGIATVNTDICEKLGLDFEQVKATFLPLCTDVKSIKTAESFED